ncbi:MAG: domain S-box-containing protein [Myxococcaceae bacterium]|nr:domain S-box-containing protein [Myxococcaceae bacterium]
MDAKTSHFGTAQSRDALDGVGVGLIELDSNRRVTFLSPRAQLIFSLPGLLGATIDSLLRPMSPGGDHFLFSSADGSTRVLKLKFLDSFCALVTDVSEQARLAGQLHLAQAALESAANAIMITDSNGMIEYTNPAFTRMTGYSPEEVKGKKTSLLNSGAHDETFYKKLWTTLSAGFVWHGRFTNRRKDGTLFEDESTIAPIRGDEVTPTRYIAIKTDITAQLRLEHATQRNERLGLIGQLASSVAHDLNNLLLPLKLVVPRLKAQVRDPFGHDLVSSLEQSADRASGLVQQLLDFVRGGRSVRAPIDLSDFVRSHLATLAIGLPAGVQLRDQCVDGALLTVDANQFFQVLQNLVLNAADAGAREILIRCGRADGNTVALSVSDDGNGIPPEALPHIFEPFFTTKPIGRGTGLGLATVQRIVEAHGGTLTVRSEARGTHFTLVFPGQA